MLMYDEDRDMWVTMTYGETRGFDVGYMYNTIEASVNMTFTWQHSECYKVSSLLILYL